MKIKANLRGKKIYLKCSTCDLKINNEQFIRLTVFVLNRTKKNQRNNFGLSNYSVYFCVNRNEFLFLY